MSSAAFSAGRLNLHKKLIQDETLAYSPVPEKNHKKLGGITEIASFGDVGQKLSAEVSNRLAEVIADKVDLPLVRRSKKKDGQTLGNEFEDACADFVRETFLELSHLRPGKWIVEKVSSRKESLIGRYAQYSHLSELNGLMDKYTELRSFLGEGYAIAPDVIIARLPEEDAEINLRTELVDGSSAKQAVLRKENQYSETETSILHASISCKYTMRSDRAQNTRTEALNLIRARKGRTPHIVAVTAEPIPNRIVSLALGTGDLDCTYHFALYELRETLLQLGKEESLDTLDMMIEGKRLKDISDLPLDLAV
ncbi:NgoMIV family type II restriction endonuclease [Aestuariispira insulae]|uniref:NgoMIV restriction enzyme n=1 Tax=Aestuariispira insulae TaxID=1461337 RepID=A0A3D9HVM7_9PROT|nr:NgoMIV family type II restriction endonuclease [Aestuariispira insulae]RED53479.1 NgoMIV restriction enzyme [Aestuariispira insulae]